MGPVRVVILLVALVAAVGAAVLVRGMAQGQAPAPVAAPAPQVIERPMTDVLIAKRDLPPGTILVEDDLGWQAWPKDSLNELFLTKESVQKPDDTNKVVKAAEAAGAAAVNAVAGPGGIIAELVGTVVREPILAGEPMTRRKVVRAGSAGIMAITLQPGMRAIAVPLSAESAAGGFILPGDHVDVVQSREVDTPGATGGKRFVSETVLRNVKVLAVDQATGTEGSSVVGATATLELSSNQAEVLVLSKAQGSLTLVLRSYADTAGPTETVARTLQDGADALGMNTAVVRVFRNSTPTEVQVNR
jgi:pilus assembly protein CpaB